VQTLHVLAGDVDIAAHQEDEGRFDSALEYARQAGRDD
jgi:hypothetical protein